MGGLKASGNAKLIIGLISPDTLALDRVKGILEETFKNSVDFESGTMDFVHTDYYREEMGERLKRKFLSFANPVSLKDIYKVKLQTNLIEKRFLNCGKRTVNIDPGYLDLSKLVLFSTKDYSHRIYMDEGVFAEVTLHYRDKSFAPWPWTYPDYKTKDYIDIFNSIRENYKKALKTA